MSPCLFCACGVVIAAGIGWLAALVHLTGRAPVGVTSLGVGALLGVAVAVLARWNRVVCVRRLVLGTVALALVVVVVEHAWLYRDFRRQWQASRSENPQVAMFRAEEPWSPGEYFAREATPGRAALWAVDVALIAGAAVGVVLAVRKRGA